MIYINDSRMGTKFILRNLKYLLTQYLIYDLNSEYDSIVNRYSNICFKSKDARVELLSRSLEDYRYPLLFLSRATRFCKLVDPYIYKDLLSFLYKVYGRIDNYLGCNSIYGKEIEHYITNEDIHRIVYDTGYIKYYFPESLRHEMKISPGEYIYKLDGKGLENLEAFIPVN